MISANEQCRVATARVEAILDDAKTDALGASKRLAEICMGVHKLKKSWSNGGKKAFVAAYTAVARRLAGPRALKKAVRTESYLKVVDIRMKIEEIGLTIDHVLDKRTRETYANLAPGLNALICSSSQTRGKAGEILAAVHVLTVLFPGSKLVATHEEFEPWDSAFKVVEAHGYPRNEVIVDSTVRDGESTDVRGRVRATHHAESDFSIVTACAGQLIKVQIKSVMAKADDKNNLIGITTPTTPGMLGVVVAFVPTAHVLIQDFRETAPKAKSFSKSAGTALELREKLVRDNGAIELTYVDALYPELIALARRFQNASMDVTRFFKSVACYESNSTQKSVLERLLAHKLGASLMPYGSPYDMYIQRDSGDTLVRIDSKGGNICYNQGVDAFTVRAHAMKFDNADKFYLLKVINHVVDDRPMAIVSEFHPVFHSDGVTINTFATPNLSTTGDRQITNGFDYAVVGSHNTRRSDRRARRDHREDRAQRQRDDQSRYPRGRWHHDRYPRRLEGGGRRVSRRAQTAKRLQD